MSFETIVLVFAAPVVLFMTWVCIWMNTKGGRRWLGEEVEDEGGGV
jgi:hypothetical protein